jgi:predicted ATPase
MIEELEITNFKAFASTEVRFGGYTLLSGLNSSGKSTVIQALALLRQARDYLRVRDDSSGLPLNGELVELGTGRDALTEDYVSTGDELEIGFRIQAKNGREREWRFRYGPEDDFLPLTASRPSDAVLVDEGAFYGLYDSTFSVFREGFQYLRADRINPAVTFPRSYEMSVRRGFLGTRGEYATDYLSHHQADLVESTALRYPDTSSQLLAQVEGWMGEICPGVRIQAAAIERTDLVRLDYRFVHAEEVVTGPRRPTNVGFGLTYVLPIVIACLTAKPGALLLLENPEAHLHPRGQSAMARLTCAAAASGAQVVVETHSDHILNGVRLAVKRGLLPAEDTVLQYFRRKGVGIDIVTPIIGSDGMISHWPTGFFDEWDHALDELLD